MPAGLALPVLVSRLRAAGCVFAEDEARLLVGQARTPAALAAMVDQRVAGLPLEHVLGWAEFGGVRVAVAPGVFIPRRRTEFLVRCASEVVRPHAVVVDMCCGSGALGAALAALQGEIELHASDIDPAAVRCARRNLAPLRGHVYAGDLFESLPVHLRGGIDVLLANVPYVPTGDLRLLPQDSRTHEARAALDGGADGLDILRRVAAAAPAWLAPGGHLLVEISAGQVRRAGGIVAERGLTGRVAVCEDLDATVLVAAKTPRQTADG